jgi:phosphoglucosamine mutase
VLKSGADVGIALDGDGDRAILVDERGELFDGDDMMALMGARMAARGRLNSNTVVATVMSNFGLERALADAGVRLVRTEVGDPAVVREMRAHGYNLGGEQSGHVVFMDCSTTGDGLITALQALAAMVESGRPLGELRKLRRAPQVLRNVRVRERTPLDSIPEIARAIAAAAERLGGSGRLLVRYSGTEMLARVMVEGEDESAIAELADEIAWAIERRLGASE